MKLMRWATFIFLCILLQACASSKVSQEVQQGKTCFKDGEYKQSFRKLMPAAVSGDPQAEYAVGYMYYYGYGVSRDEESGIFWMNKSADQGYSPAVKALNLIHCANNKDTCPYHAQPEKVKRETYKKDAVLRSITEPPPASVRISADNKPVSSFKSYSNTEISQLKKTAKRTEKVSNSPVATSSVHVPSKPKEFSLNKKYSLQMFGSYHLADVKNLQKGLKNATHIWHTQHNGKDWYVLTYGQYPSVMRAKLAMDTLPREVSGYKPWVRDVGVIDEVG